jgi:hypothetical protein
MTVPASASTVRLLSVGMVGADEGTPASTW